MNLANKTFLAGLFLGLMSATAQAAYIVDIRQIGADVVASGHGALDTSLLSKRHEIGTITGSLDPGDAIVTIGNGNVDGYYFLSGPDGFGSNITSITDTFAGVPVGIIGEGNGAEIDLTVPVGYVSGEQLGTSSATFRNESFTSLGIVAGTYVYSFGNRTGFDTFTVNAIPSLPLPGAAPLFGFAMVAFGLFGYGRSRETVAVA